MSAYTAVLHTLKCDYPGCRQQVGPYEQDLYALRQEARRRGWLHLWRKGMASRQDRCPGHKHLL